MAYPSKTNQELYQAILKLKNLNEAAKFFRDLLTLPEIEDFSQRFQIAKELHKGKSYAQVAKEVKASTTTVSRVAHWLHRGQGGYRLILDRLFPKKK
jgi:TrpR-related protein YerC/YecD